MDNPWIQLTMVGRKNKTRINNNESAQNKKKETRDG